MPVPAPNLYPSPSLYPGAGNVQPGAFAELLTESIAPWADNQGVWTAYNNAIATMFETVYDLVADLGDPNQTELATLSAQLDPGTEITSLPTSPLVAPVTADQYVTTTTTYASQNWLVTRTAGIGSTSISVSSQIVNSSYPINSQVANAYTPGWSSLLDPANCPNQFLPYLGQFVGTAIPPSLDATTARLIIQNECGLLRGTVKAILYATKRNLSGTQSAIVIERSDINGNPNPYYFLILVRPEEVVSVSALTDAVNNVKPAGLLWTLVQTDGVIWLTETHTFATDSVTWNQKG